MDASVICDSTAWKGTNVDAVDVQRTESLYKVKDFLCNYFFSFRSLAINLSLENITSFRKQRFKEPISLLPLLLPSNRNPLL